MDSECCKILVKRPRFTQSWYNLSHTSDNGYNCRIFKTQFGYKRYLTILPFPVWRHVCNFRVDSHRLPIEVGRFINLPRNMRICHVCNTDSLVDEFHFLFEYKVFDNLCPKYFKPAYKKNGNAVKFDKLNYLNRIENRIEYIFSIA